MLNGKKSFVKLEGTPLRTWWKFQLVMDILRDLEGLINCML